MKIRERHFFAHTFTQVKRKLKITVHLTERSLASSPLFKSDNSVFILKYAVKGFICQTLEAWDIAKYGFFLDWAYVSQYAGCGIPGLHTEPGTVTGVQLVHSAHTMVACWDGLCLPMSRNIRVL